MTSLISNRLQIIPLSHSDLEQLSTSRAALETARCLDLSNFELNADARFMAEFEAALTHFVIPNLVAHPDQWFWFTHWIIVHRDLNLTIGGLGMAGPPDTAGQVMIGYFMDKKFEGNGYATEAVSCFVDWIFQQPDVKTVIADTLKEYNASQRVLQKTGFTFVGEVEEGVRWLKKRPAKPVQV
ncbi:GNAT family N-acetyltransferase [Larkinella rosea]|uniref:N-acetyltransferase n=1 Tax=Larkinella rosea TaxID=2025312 RepID=A0A3P1BIQ2_9BACT|nr:GNAT family N-acetyltransferase [Larkinella rosea]RRB00997.1 N-acetyltransferase [Larkinella rosea]